jgi:hypothetical protein
LNSPSHEELPVKGHEKGSMMGIHQKMLLVKGHKEELTRGIPISRRH